MSLPFHKFHGLGNDFIIVRGHDFFARADGPGTVKTLVREMCRRHYGIGADGLIALEPTTDADFKMHLWNADGGRAEMSGNGLRCAVAFLYLIEGWSSDVMRVATDAGIKPVTLIARASHEVRLSIEIGFPRLHPRDLPVTLEAEPPLIDVPINVDGDIVQATLTSMGNPHCSVFLPSLDSAELFRLGSALENHPMFPARTNVEFVAVVDRSRIRVRFWERGVGHTLSSGTGSCAAAVAAMLKGKVDRVVTVETDAGDLSVEWPENGSVVLTGPARFVYHGVWP